MAAGFHFAGAEGQLLPDLELAGDPGQAGFAHQFGAGAGHRAFVGARPAQVELFGHDQVEQRVAEEFQALVVRAARAAVGQGLPQQARVGEPVPAERIAGIAVVHSRDWLVRRSEAWNLPTTSRLPISGLRTSYCTLISQPPSLRSISTLSGFTFSA